MDFWQPFLLSEVHQTHRQPEVAALMAVAALCSYDQDHHSSVKGNLCVDPVHHRWDAFVTCNKEDIPSIQNWATVWWLGGPCLLCNTIIFTRDVSLNTDRYVWMAHSAARPPTPCKHSQTTHLFWKSFLTASLSSHYITKEKKTPSKNCMVLQLRNPFLFILQRKKIN